MEMSVDSHPHLKSNSIMKEVFGRIPNEQLCNASNCSAGYYSNIKGNLKKILQSRKTFDDEMMNLLLISPRPGLHHLLIDEVNELM